jgi:pyrroline-5-carboxylate reductase
MKKNVTYAFIGVGNMGTSLVGGLLADGCPASRIMVSDIDPERRHELHDRFSVTEMEDNCAAAAAADVVVLAVKPQVMPQVVPALKSSLGEERRLVISIAAGVGLPLLQRWLGPTVPLVRAMPNTPALVQSGATLLCAGPEVSQPQRDLAESTLRSVGITLWVENETLMDLGTAVSGSGPAYFFLTMEAMETAAMELGLDPQTARILILQTALGSARLALESSVDPAELRARVTSPGGTTEAALRVLQRGGLRDSYREAIRAARDRSMELSKLLEDS